MEALSQIAAQIGVDKTALIQMIPFLISYIFISQFIFKPYSRNLEYRRKNAGGNASEAQALNASIDRLATEYQTQVRQQNQETEKIYSTLKAEGQKQEEQLVNTARENANKLLEEARTKIQKDTKQIRDELTTQIPQMSNYVASQVLGRELR